jgi:hypothetical protein
MTQPQQLSHKTLCSDSKSGWLKRMQNAKPSNGRSYRDSCTLPKVCDDPRFSMVSCLHSIRH